MKYEIVHPESLQAGDIAAWSELLRAEPAFQSPLLSPHFAKLVGAQRRDARVIISRDRPESPVFLPFMLEATGKARPIGAPFSDYHAVIAANDTRIDIAELMEAAGIQVWPYAGLIDPAARFATTNSGTHQAYQIVLGEGGAAQHLEMARARSAKRFKNWRRLEHKLARDHGAITLTAPDRSVEAFALLMKWKREQLYRSGLQDVLRPNWIQLMMRQLLSQDEPDFGGLMITLRVGGRPVAAHFGARNGSVFHPWIAAFDPAFAEYSVGNTHMLHAISAMDVLGLTTYDLATGSDHYKHCYASGMRDVEIGAYVAEQSHAKLDLWQWASGKKGTARAAIVQRVRTRLDHIAATENTLGGRALGIFDAFNALSRRSMNLRNEEAA